MESNHDSSQKQKKPTFQIPRNYVRELEVLAIVIIAGSLITILGRDTQLALALGSSLFTGATIGAITLTSNAFRERRANLEKLTVLGIRLHSRLQWIKPNGIDTFALPEIDNMLTELKDAEAVFGRLWFFCKADRAKAFELYSYLYKVSKVEVYLMQYRLTTSNRSVDIDRLKMFFEELFEENPHIVERLNELTDWSIDFCKKAYF